jgi:LPXTG-motif cell wall-anchored protein
MLSSGNSQNAIVPLTVINTRGFDLPQTGDTSMITLTIVASVFAVSTAALFLVLRHYRKKDDNSNE